jgi:hypothetical protein
MKRLWICGAPLAVLALGMLPASAQTVIGAKSGVINWVEGEAFLADKPYTMQPSQFGEVKEGMILRTGEGRAEVLLPPGVLLRIAEKSSFKMISNRLIDTRVELLAGSGIVEVDDLAKEATVTVVCRDGTVSLTKPGLYRFDTEPAQIKVFKGTAEVALGGQNASVSAGKMMPLSGAVASVEKFDAAQTDSFDHWSRRRGELLANANISSAKRANDHYGSYGSDPCYGSAGSYSGPYGTGPFARPWGTWSYNPYYGLGTYVPCQGRITSPYGYAYWSPFAVYQAFYAPRPTYGWNPGGGYGGPGHTGTGSGGYSGAAAGVGPHMGGVGNPGAAATFGSSSAASAGAGSAGHGGGGGGGRGK